MNAEDDDARVEASGLHELVAASAARACEAAAERPRPAAAPFFLAAAFCMSSLVETRPRMLYATQPSTGMNAEDDDARVEASGLHELGGGVRLLGHAEEGGGRPRPAATPFFLAAAFCMSSSWLRPGPRMLYDPAKHGDERPR